MTTPQHAAQPTAETSAYTPVFSATVRTYIYILCVVASVVGLAFMLFSDAAVGGFISTAAGFIASSFGVAYNPLRMS